LIRINVTKLINYCDLSLELIGLYLVINHILCNAKLLFIAIKWLSFCMTLRYQFWAWIMSSVLSSGGMHWTCRL